MLGARCWVLGAGCWVLGRGSALEAGRRAWPRARAGTPLLATARPPPAVMPSYAWSAQGVIPGFFLGGHCGKVTSEVSVLAPPHVTRQPPSWSRLSARSLITNNGPPPPPPPAIYPANVCSFRSVPGTCLRRTDRLPDHVWGQLGPGKFMICSPKISSPVFGPAVIGIKVNIKINSHLKSQWGSS